MIKFVGLRAKIYTYLIDKKVVMIKKQKAQKVCHKKKLKFENYKNCLEATQLENKPSRKKNNIDTDSFFCLKRKHKEFIKHNKLILKIQQRFKSER